MGTDRRAYLLLAALVALPACSTAQDAAKPPPPARGVAKVQATAPAYSDTTQAKTHSDAQFPRELVGLWIGTPYKCPTPDEGFDGEDIMDISPDKLVGYEEIYKPISVTLISDSPKTWKIETLIDVGPSDVFSEFGPITFSISDGILTADHKPKQVRFKKCKWQQGE